MVRKGTHQPKVKASHFTSGACALSSHLDAIYLYLKLMGPTQPRYTGSAIIRALKWLFGGMNQAKVRVDGRRHQRAPTRGLSFATTEQASSHESRRDKQPTTTTSLRMSVSDLVAQPTVLRFFPLYSSPV